MLQQIVIADMTNLQWRYGSSSILRITLTQQWSGYRTDICSVYHQQLYRSRDRSGCLAKLVRCHSDYEAQANRKGDGDMQW